MAKVHIRQLDDRGLSLVELLVAVAILAVIALPLAHAFVTGANISARSDTLGSATGAAGNAAESIEALHTDALTALLRSGGSVCGVPVSDATAYDEAGDALPDIEDGAAKYSFTLKGLAYSGGVYDGYITLDASGFDENARPVTVYTAMDAVFAQPTGQDDPDSRADAGMEADRASLGGVLSSPRRNVSLSLSGGDGGVSAFIRYGYTAEISASVKGQSITVPAGSTYSYTAMGESGDGTPSVYIMFQPYSMNDSFTIAAPAELSCNVFLVAQGELKPGYSVSVGGIREGLGVYSNAAINAAESSAYIRQSLNRLYAVTIELRSPVSGESVYTLETTKLN